MVVEVLLLQIARHGARFVSLPGLKGAKPICGGAKEIIHIHKKMPFKNIIKAIIVHPHTKNKYINGV